MAKKGFRSKKTNMSVSPHPSKGNDDPRYKLCRGTVDVAYARDRETIDKSFARFLMYFVDCAPSMLSTFIKINRPNTTVFIDSSQALKIEPHPDFYGNDKLGYARAVDEWLAKAIPLAREVDKNSERIPNKDQSARICDLLCDLLWINDIVITGTSYYSARVIKS